VGDIIHSVNGQEMWGKSLAEYTDRLKGPSGSMVPLSPAPISGPVALELLLLFCFKFVAENDSDRLRYRDRWRLASCDQQHTQQRHRGMEVEVLGTTELQSMAQTQMPLTCALMEKK